MNKKILQIYCDEDVWVPCRPGEPMWEIVVTHVCDPERRKQIIKEWEKRDDKAKKMWYHPPTCPYLSSIDVNEFAIMK